MDINDTTRILREVSSYEHRPVDDALINQWQHALTRQKFEHVFDAVHDHFESCAEARKIPLTPAEVLGHINEARVAREAAEKRARDLERNESVFGELADHRTDTEREASLAAMRAGRAHLDAVLADIKTRRPTPVSEGSTK